MSLELLPLSQRPDLRASFLSAGEKLRHAECAKNAPGSTYSAFVLTAVPADRQEAWLAMSGGEVLGRVAAFDQTQATIGLFEVDVRNPQASACGEALLAAAKGWLKSRGRETLYGPIDGSTWFQYRLREYTSFPPSANYRWEPTTPPEYQRIFEQAGFRPVERYHSYGFRPRTRKDLRARALLIRPATWKASLKGFRLVPLLTEKTDREIDELLSAMYRLSAEGFSGNFLYEPIPESVFKALYSRAVRELDLSFSFRLLGPEDEVAGFIFAYPDEGAVIVKSLAIRNVDRGKGLSTALLAGVIQHAYDRGVPEVISALVKRGSVSEFLEGRNFSHGIETWRQDYVLYGLGPEIASASSGSRIPGPEGLQIIERVRARRKSAVDFYVGLHESYGDIVRLPLGVTSFYILADPDAVKQVLLDRYRDYRKGPGFDRLGLVIGKGLITSEGELWKKQRRTIHPTFTRERLSGFAAQMGAICERRLSKWNDRTAPIELDLAAEMNELSLALVSETLLGSDMQEESRRVGEAFNEVLSYFDRMLVSPARFLELLPSWGAVRWMKDGLRSLPTAENRRFRAALTELNQVVDSVIDRRAKGGKDAGGLVAALLEARDEETGEGMSREQLRDEVMTILLAGHETTANALLWTWVLLSQNPTAADRVFEESRGREGYSLEQLAGLKFTQAVFEEGMRHFPPVWRMTRQAIVDTEIAGHRIPKGSMVVIAQYLLHRHPKHWGSDAHCFRPERFMDPVAAKSRHRFAYIPFGAGPRICIGNHFASLEAQIVLSSFSSRYRVEVLNPGAIELDPKITLRPRGEVRARLVPRLVPFQ